MNNRKPVLFKVDGQDIYEFRIKLHIAKLIWANHPLHTQTNILVQSFGKEYPMRFENSQLNYPCTVTFQICNSETIQAFYQNSMKFIFIQGRKQIGRSGFNGRIMQEKMVLPIFSSGRESRKLGDFQIRVEIHKSVTNKIVMKELSLFLDRLEKEKCCELIKLYDELERQKYV